MTRRTRLVASGVAVAVVAVGVGGTAYARSREDDAGDYRTVLARTGTVEQTLSTTGTVDSADRADVEAGVSGNVASVAVAAGQKVKAGAVLLRLGTQDLRADLDQANATLATARAQLESDQDAQSSTVSSAASGGSGSGGATRSKGSGGQGSSGSAGSKPVDTKAVKAALAALKQQQAAVTSAQSEATTALKAATDALADQQQKCRDAFQTKADGTTDGAANQACQDALAVVKDKQEDADAAQQRLAGALKTLSDTLSAAISKLDAAVGGGTTSPSATTAAYRTSTSRTATVVLTAAVTTADATGPSQTGQSGQTGQTGQAVTAATLAKDQAAIDSARADVLTAEQALEAAVVTAPISGTVAQLDLAKGDSVTAGDTAAVITHGTALVVTSSVSETAVRSVAVGQTVRVSTPGTATTSTGQVTSIGLVGDTSGGSATYPVTIAVAQPQQTLPVGSSVLVDIVLATAEKAVTVPASAITTTGTRTTVTVLADGAVTPTQVTLGAKGSRTVAVTKGLKAGARVVLADLDASVTGASSTLNNRGGFPGGGPAGGPGGGPGGGPPR